MINIGCDTLVNLTGHQDTLTGNYINNATVTASVLDGDTTLFSASLSYVASSNGNYRGTFSAAQTGTLADGNTYVVQWVATSTSGTLTIREQEQAAYLS